MIETPKILPLPNPNSVDPDGRGGASEHALADFRRRLEAHAPAQQLAADTADAIERRRLISEVRTMRRYRINVAIEGAIRGVTYAGVAWGLWHVGRWLLDELRRPPNLPPPSSPPDDRRAA